MDMPFSEQTSSRSQDNECNQAVLPGGPYKNVGRTGMKGFSSSTSSASSAFGAVTGQDSGRMQYSVTSCVS